MGWNNTYNSRHCEPLAAKQSGGNIIFRLLRFARNDGSKGFLFCFAILLFFLISCSVSYKFEGGSVNYDLTKTIHIADFPDRTSNYSPLASMFNLALRKRFIEQTRLKEVGSNADIEMEGEISNFDLAGMAVKGDAYSSQTRLTITVRIQYFNNKEAGKDVNQSFSAFQEFPSTQSLDAVQDDLVKKIVDELVDMIYNATIANW